MNAPMSLRTVTTVACAPRNSSSGSSIGTSARTPSRHSSTRSPTPGLPERSTAIIIRVSGFESSSRTKEPAGNGGVSFCPVGARQAEVMAGGQRIGQRSLESRVKDGRDRPAPKSKPSLSPRLVPGVLVGTVGITRAQTDEVKIFFEISPALTQVVRCSFGSERGSSWISFSARGSPSASSWLRSRSAFSS